MEFEARIQIDAAHVVLWVKGDAEETNLGVFQLPCRIPVLRHGKIDRITIEPVVKQNGIASTRIAYPFYKVLTFENIYLAPDSVTAFDTLTTRYISRQAMKVAWQEFFEPGQNSIRLDTCVDRISNKPDTVLSDHGCGVVRVKKDQKYVNFWADTTFRVSDPTAYIYLEMEYWSDFDFSVGFNNPQVNGGQNEIRSAMTIYKNDRWNKIYINLGRLWAWYNYYPDIRLYFTILNNEGREGNLFLDNMKVVVK